MLGDLSRDDWQSALGIAAHQVPAALLLRGTRNLKAQYKAYCGYFDNVQELSTPNGVLEDVFIGERNGITVAYASVYGAPMAAEVVHAFGAIGTKLVVQTGCCGGLDPVMKPGDLVVVGEALCGEGASMYYTQNASVMAQTEAPQMEPTTEWVVHYGKIYTTSALFAQNQAMLDEWFGQDCVAADMETAATFAVAERFEMERASLLYVFDCPRAGNHVMSDSASLRQRRHEANAIMIEKALELIDKSC